MRWHFFVAYFFGGALLVNAIPHIVNGVSGRSFPTPFSSPPGKGLSSPMVNVLLGTLNAVVGYFLVSHVGEFHIRSIPDMLVMGAGGLLMAVMLARTFGRLYGGQQDGRRFISTSRAAAACRSKLGDSASLRPRDSGAAGIG